MIFFDALRGGGGGGVHPDFFVKLYFKIAVVQQTRARDQTFEGVSAIVHWKNCHIYFSIVHIQKFSQID